MSLKRRRFAKALRARFGAWETKPGKSGYGGPVQRPFVTRRPRCFTYRDEAVDQRLFKGARREVCAWCASAIDQEVRHG